MILKFIGKVLTGIKVRLGEYGDVMVYEIKMKVWIKIGMFDWVLVIFFIWIYYWDEFYVW